MTTSTHDILIRKAEAADLPTLRIFEQGVITAERPFDPTIKPGHVQYYDLEYMLEADHIRLVVAEFEGEPIASGYARIEKSKHYIQNEQYAYVGFLYTRPEYRGKGVIQKVIEALKQWALTQNMTELQLDVYFDNLPAKRAYEKAGFLKHLLRMRMPVSQP